MNKFQINDDTYQFAQDAMRDILFMYWDIVESGGDFGATIDTGRFNPYLFINTSTKADFACSVDIDLLRQGSSVDLLILLTDYLDCDEPPKRGTYLGDRLYELVDNKLLDHVPEAREAIISGLEFRDDFLEKSKEVYIEYILKFFRKMGSK